MHLVLVRGAFIHSGLRGRDSELRHVLLSNWQVPDPTTRDSSVSWCGERIYAGNTQLVQNSVRGFRESVLIPTCTCRYEQFRIEEQVTKCTQIGICFPPGDCVPKAFPRGLPERGNRWQWQSHCAQGSLAQLLEVCLNYLGIANAKISWTNDQISGGMRGH